MSHAIPLSAIPVSPFRRLFPGNPQRSWLERLPRGRSG